jgi:hypothetical protein
MAQSFKLIELQKHPEHSMYSATIEYGGFTGKYEIRTEAKIRFFQWARSDLQVLVLDGCDNTLNGDPFYFEITGLDYHSQRNAPGIRKAFLKMIKEDSRDKSFKDRR